MVSECPVWLASATYMYHFASKSNEKWTRKREQERRSAGVSQNSRSQAVARDTMDTLVRLVFFFFFCVLSYNSAVHHLGWDFCICDRFQSNHRGSHILSSWILGLVLAILPGICYLTGCSISMMLFGCFTSQQHGSVSLRLICSDNCACCPTEI